MSPRLSAPAARPRRPPGFSLKLRLSLLITLLIVLMMLAGGAYIVRQARQDIRAEVRSTMSLTGHFLDAQLAVLQDRKVAQGEDAAPRFRLRELRDVRHLSVEWLDTDGRLLESSQERGERTPLAPAWFVWLVRAAGPPLPAIRRPVLYHGERLGELVIRADPTWEIDEIWSTSRGLLLLLAVFFGLIIGLVWWAVAHALRPVEYILGALGDIEQGNLAARLPPFGMKEMARISFGFNHMAETLELSIANNHALSRRLMQMQEEEREYLARELHDEIGQCVTAIHADAVAIRRHGGAAVQAGAAAIVEAVGRIQHGVRSILRRLRPGTLDDVGLEAALRELTGAFRQRHPGVSCALEIAPEVAAVQGELGIGLYRIAQECLTNVSRHAGASAVQVSLRRQGAGGAAGVELCVSDDGRGFEQRAVGRGFGLLGIRERALALGGSCQMDAAGGGGARVRVRVPLGAAP
jgi:two-component system sensor histidine kinase UhpB